MSSSGTGCCTPGVGHLKSCPGIAELVLKVIAILLAISLFISGVANINNVNDGIDFVEENSIIRDFVSLPDAQLMRAASGWLIFCATIAIMYELSVIILRFLNFTVVSSNITLLIVVDSIAQGVLALAIFSGAAAMASHIQDWLDVQDELDNFDPSETTRDAERHLSSIIFSANAVSFIGFVLMIILIVVVILVIVGAFAVKCKPKSGTSTASAV